MQIINANIEVPADHRCESWKPLQPFDRILKTTAKDYLLMAEAERIGKIFSLTPPNGHNPGENRVD